MLVSGILASGSGGSITLPGGTAVLEPLVAGGGCRAGGFRSGGAAKAVEIASANGISSTVAGVIRVFPPASVCSVDRAARLKVPSRLAAPDETW
jgi:hypothetical protein